MIVRFISPFYFPLKSPQLLSLCPQHSSETFLWFLHMAVCCPGELMGPKWPAQVHKACVWVQSAYHFHGSPEQLHTDLNFESLFKSSTSSRCLRLFLAFPGLMIRFSTSNNWEILEIKFLMLWVRGCYFWFGLVFCLLVFGGWGTF